MVKRLKIAKKKLGGRQHGGKSLVVFRKELGPAWSCQEEFPDDWISTPNMIRKTSREALAMSSQRKVHKEISAYKERC